MQHLAWLYLEVNVTIFEYLQGRKVDVHCETGYHIVIICLRESELEWKALAMAAEGAHAVEKEPYSSYDLGDGKYMVNWIEESGLVVSQVADEKNGKVYAFMTWQDEKARGKRAELLYKGT